MDRKLLLTMTSVAASLVVSGCTQWQTRPPKDHYSAVSDDLNARLQQSNAQLAEAQRERMALAQRASQAESQARAQAEVQAIMEQRVENLRRENDRIAGELASTLLVASGDRTSGNIVRTSAIGSPAADFPPEVRKKLEEFANNNDNVKFVWGEKAGDKPFLRFQTHNAFVDASDQLTTQSKSAFRDLARIMNSRAMKDWDFTVVGHTFAQSQVSNQLTPLHATDWHLAAHQAIAAIQFMEEQGVPPSRFCALSYGSQQPLREESGDDDVSKRRSARLEVYFERSVAK